MTAGAAAPANFRSAQFDGSLAFTTLGITVTVFGNFTLQRTLNWTWSTPLRAFSTSVSMVGAVEMALVQQPQPASSNGSASSAPPEQQVVAVLRPVINGSLDVLSPTLPGPGFSGNYSWRGSLLMTPDPFAAWAAATNTTVNKRLRSLAQAGGGSALRVPVEGPLAVQEWGRAPAPADATGGDNAGGDGGTGNIYLDPDGSVQLVGELPPEAGVDSEQLTCVDSTCYLVAGKAASITAAKAKASRPGALSRRDMIIVIATTLGGPLAIGLCCLLVAAAAMLRRRREAEKRRHPTAAVLGLSQHRLLGAHALQPPPLAVDADNFSGVESSGPSLVLVAPNGRGLTALRAGGAPAAPPGAAARMSGFGGSGFFSSVSGSSAAQISAVLGTLGFGWRRSGTLPGGRYLSGVGDEAGGGGQESGGGGAAGGDARRAAARRRSRVRSIDLPAGITLSDVFSSSGGGGGGSAPEAAGGAAGFDAAAAMGLGPLPAAGAGVQMQRVGIGRGQQQHLPRSDDEDDNQKPPAGFGGRAASPPGGSGGGRFGFLSRLLAGRATSGGSGAAAAAHQTPSAHHPSHFNPLFDPDDNVLEGSMEEHFSWDESGSGATAEAAAVPGGRKAGAKMRARLSSS